MIVIVSLSIVFKAYIIFVQISRLVVDRLKLKSPKMSTKCILKNLRKGLAKELPDIEINDSGKKVIGRNQESQIESPAVSREHRKQNCTVLFDFLILIRLFCHSSHDKAKV